MRSAAIIIFICITCFSQSGHAALPVSLETRLTQLEQRAAKSATTAAGEYARELLDAAKSSIAEAKISSAAGKEKVAALHMELADIQLNAADVKGAEKELLEKVAIRRSELKKLEARLERFRQGEE